VTSNHSRRIKFVGSSQKDIMAFPLKVKDVAAHALNLAAAGLKHADAKPLKGPKGAAVMELVMRNSGDAYRVVYTTRYADAIYVIHAFKKKSSHGIGMPKPDQECIGLRLKALNEDRQNQTAHRSAS
jgi:phage-related protein